MKTKVPIYTLLFLLTACDFPEHYFTSQPVCVQEEIFTKFSDSTDAEYQKIALEKLSHKKPHEFRYFFKTFLEENQQTYMLTNFRNETTCFDVKLRINKLGKLAGMYRLNGRSYPKELYDLKWTSNTFQGKNEIVYIDMHDIID